MGKLNNSHFIEFIKKKITTCFGENFVNDSNLLKTNSKLRYVMTNKISEIFDCEYPLYDGLVLNDSLFFDLDFLDNQIKIIIKK